MTTWADEIDPISLEENFGDGGETSPENKDHRVFLNDDAAAWEDAKSSLEILTDSDNKRYEVLKKVRTYHVDRPATVVDIRAKWKRFGKKTDCEQDLMSRDPPIVLELGDVDPLERVAREEIVRLVNEMERTKVGIADPRLSRFVKLREEKEKAAREASGMADHLKERTWAAARGERVLALRKEDTNRRLRITNISDDISREELYTIFSTAEYRIEKLFLPRDRDTGNYRGFAFITFEDSAQAERCLKKTKGVARFKNTVMRIVRALPEGEQKRY